MRIFRRNDPTPHTVEKLSQEIQARRRQVHDVIAEMLTTATPEAAAGGRVYQVFASFQADFPPGSPAE